MCKQAMHEIRQKIHLCKKEHESARNPLNELCRNRKNGEEAFASSPHCSATWRREALPVVTFTICRSVELSADSICFVGPSNNLLTLFV